MKNLEWLISWGCSRSLSKRLMYISGLDVTVYRVRVVVRAWILDLRLMIGWFVLVAFPCGTTLNSTNLQLQFVTKKHLGSLFLGQV